MLWLVCLFTTRYMILFQFMTWFHISAWMDNFYPTIAHRLCSRSISVIYGQISMAMFISFPLMDL
jgi:hypothetical protein